MPKALKNKAQGASFSAPEAKKRKAKHKGPRESRFAKKKVSSWIYLMRVKFSLLTLVSVYDNSLLKVTPVLEAGSNPDSNNTWTISRANFGGLIWWFFAQTLRHNPDCFSFFDCSEEMQQTLWKASNSRNPDRQKNPSKPSLPSPGLWSTPLQTLTCLTMRSPLEHTISGFINSAKKCLSMKSKALQHYPGHWAIYLIPLTVWAPWGVYLLCCQICSTPS